MKPGSPPSFGTINTEKMTLFPHVKSHCPTFRLAHLDLYLVHWPFPNHHPPGCDVSARYAHAVPYIHENDMRTWRKMEELVDRGLVRHIGTSNMTISKMELLLRDARIKPVANEMELHPHFQQPDFFRYLLDKGIQPIGYSPIGSPGRPERDRTPEDTSPVEDPVILEIAQNLGVHPAVVCIKWAIQRGQIPIPFSANPRNMLSNLLGVIGKPLALADMEAIAKLDRNCRLRLIIKTTLTFPIPRSLCSWIAGTGAMRLRSAYEIPWRMEKARHDFMSSHTKL